MSRLGKTILVGGSYVLRPSAPGEIATSQQITAKERRNLYRNMCPPCLASAPSLTTSGGIFYGAGWPGPDKQDVPAPTLSKAKPTCGLPGENLPERLMRKFMIGVITRDKATQLEAWKGFITIARRVGKGGEEAAADILSETIAGKRPQAAIRYFTGSVKSHLIDAHRAEKAQKRGSQFEHIPLSDYLADKKLSETETPQRPKAKKAKLGTIEEQGGPGLRFGMGQKSDFHEPAGYEPTEHRRPPKKKSRWGGVKG